MLAKNNRNNTDFQILYFLIGACHTPDGAYALLCDLHENRSDAVKYIKCDELKTKAKIIAAKRLLESKDEVDRYNGQAQIEEINASEETNQRNIKAAKDELKFIEDCMERLQPYRKYGHLPDPEAHKYAQREEWRLELINRAENSLMTSGTIPMDEFNTMRMHPDFKNSILPEITNIKHCIENGTIQDRLFSANPTPVKLLFSEEKFSGLLPDMSKEQNKLEEKNG